MLLIGMENILLKLKNKGFDPKHILDIGAYKGYWSVMANEVFPEAKITMFEPIEYEEHSNLNSSGNLNVENVLLSSCVTEVDWHEAKNTGDSIFLERTKEFENCEVIRKKTNTIDLFFNNSLEQSPELVKIDTQGSEIPIIRGGSNVFRNTEVFILEVPFFGEYNHGVPNFADHISFMDTLGYCVYDIAESHYLSDELIQFDFVFIQKNHQICKNFQNVIDNWKWDE